ncbi:hypothetical protein BJ170DRAFT_116389 [Xylariales sp. AK1849]|nr:hypothetical protein BJ170DRAFT_116389 [Xylariales sp. AK1849]
MPFNNTKRLGAFIPRNTLNDDNYTSHRLPQPDFSSRIPNPPPAKRQKLDKEAGYSDTRLDPTEEADTAPYRRNSISSANSRSDGRGTMSIQSSNNKANHGNVLEFRNSEKHVQPPKAKRRRQKNSLSISATESDVNAASDGDEDEVNLVQVIKQDDQPMVALGAMGERFARQVNGLKRKPAIEARGDWKRQRASSPDEDPLAYDQKSSNNAVSKVRTGPSPSESQRGAIKPTIFTSARPTSQRRPQKNELPKDVQARDIIKSINATGLHVHRGVSGDYKYPDSDGKRALQFTLKVHEVSTILLPTDEDGALVSEYSYLCVDLKRVHEYKYSNSEGHHIAQIFRAVDTGHSAAPILLLEFTSSEDLQLFGTWVHMKRDEPLTIKTGPFDGPKLLDKLLNLATKARKSRTLRDCDVAQPDLPEDMKLIEHSREKRAQQAQKCSRSNMRNEVPPVQRKLKNEMKATGLLAQNDKPIVIDQGPQVSDEQVSRTRSSRVPKSRETSPKGYTEARPQWVRKWRNSLVFPAQGKNRATVDKDDIPRLDEGQFLNDNLIIFGLRFLQFKLETEKPNLAQRIHFHNTFFYDKLKPSKSSAGINYDSVKGWTSKVDLFTKDFIVVPINEYSHWYVAIIYNAPKLVPSQGEPEISGVASSAPTDPVVIDDEAPMAVLNMIAEANEGDVNSGTTGVETDLRRMSIESSDGTINTTHQDHNGSLDSQPTQPFTEKCKLVVDLDDGYTDVEKTQPTNATSRRKLSKRTAPGPRRNDPSQPKIITLDSLGSAHSPACQFLRQYLVAELKDKRGIDIPDPGALGMTAKGIALQENHCDCGLYLLGYIQQFISDPNSFIRGLLQHQQPEWNVDAPSLRCQIRTLIFELQKEQQEREDNDKAAKQAKKQQAARVKRSSRPSSSEGPNTDQQSANSASPASKPGTEPQSRIHTDIPTSPRPRNDMQTPALPQRTTPGVDIGEASLVDASHSSGELTTIVKDDVYDAASSPEDALEMSIPGALPKSPSRPAQETVTAPSVEYNGRLIEIVANDEDEEEFLPPLPPSPSRPPRPSRGETPDDPVELGSSVESTLIQPRRLEDRLADQPRTKLYVEIPSRKFLKSRVSAGTFSSRPKETSHKSHHFQATQGRRPRVGRVVDASLVDEPVAKHQVEEISD